VIAEISLRLKDGRTLHVYDTGPADAGPADAVPIDAGPADAGLAVFWHHGTPNTGAPPEPLFGASAERGIRWISHDRPGYGSSTPQPGRDIAAVAADVAEIADALGLGSFGIMGHSGGGAHALACAALLPDRVLATVACSGLAPWRAEGLDWFAGMVASGQAGLRAAAAGRAAYEEYLNTAGFDQEMFTPADQAALTGEWAWLARIAGEAIDAGPEGMVEDELAATTPRGFGVEQIGGPVLIVHGGQDRVVPASHGAWLARHCRTAELRLRPDDGHVSVLVSAAVPALDWLVSHAHGGGS
jgi:pimeloyl-ACP methyl ester carboxylesterase